MEVRDAETGEILVVPEYGAAVTPSPGKQRARPSASCSLPPLRSPSASNLHLHARQDAPEQRDHGPHASSNHKEQDRPAVIFPETQSTRPMGAGVDWQRGQQARVEVSP